MTHRVLQLNPEVCICIDFDSFFVVIVINDEPFISVLCFREVMRVKEIID